MVIEHQKYNFVHHNIRGLIANYYNLQTLISIHKPDIICLQETQLGPNSTLKKSKPITFPDYKIYRKDCSPGKWGIAILVKQNIPQWEMKIRSKLEQVSVKVFYRGKEMSVTSLYLPPGLRFKDRDLEILNRQLLHHKIILTDTNAHHTLWGGTRICPRGRQILEFTNNNNLNILNRKEPTRISPRGRPTSIDLSILSPDLTIEAEWTVHTDTLGSDHLPIGITYTEDKTRINPIYTYNIKKADWALYTRNADLQIDNTNTDSKCNSIINSITQASYLSIPKNTPYIKGKIKVPWWTRECRIALNHRNRALRHYKDHPTQENFINYKKAQAEAKGIIKEAKRKSWREYISKINRNTTPADVWNTVRVIKGKRTKVGARYLRVGGRMIVNPRDIANIIAGKIQTNSSNTNCTQTFIQRKKNLESTTPNFNSNTDYNYNKPFEFHELEKVLNKVKGTSAGPDNIRYAMLKNLNIDNKHKLLDFYNDIWEKKGITNTMGRSYSHTNT